jgi:hypothetical protein
MPPPVGVVLNHVPEQGQGGPVLARRWGGWFGPDALQHAYQASAAERMLEVVNDG